MLSSTPFRTVSTVALAIALVGGAVALGGVVALDQHEDTGSDADTQQSTYLRVAHASPDAPAVDVTVGNETVLSGVEFGAVSEYLSLEAGTYNVTIAAADDPDTVLFDEEVTFEPRTVTTVAASGEVSQDAEASVEPVAFEDDGFTPGENESALGVVHLSPDAPAVDVTTANGSVVLADNVSYQNASDYVTVPAGNYTAEIRADTAANNGSVLATVDVALEGGTAYSAFAVGYLSPDDEPADTPFEVVLEEDATMTLELPGDRAMDEEDGADEEDEGDDAETDGETETDDGAAIDVGNEADASDGTGADDGADSDGDGGNADDGDEDAADGDGDDSSDSDDGTDDSASQGGPQTVDECRTIEEPGTYELTQDVGSTNLQSIDLGNGMVRQACLSIQSSDVVLDGGGSVLSGSGEDLSVGVHVYDPAGSPVQNVTIRDLQVEDWSNGVQVGVDAWAVNSAASATASIENVQSNDNDHSGFFLVGSGIELSSVVANDNGGSGIGVFYSDGMQVTGATTTGNADHGVALLAEVFDSSFAQIDTSQNDGAEIYMGELVTGNEFTDLTFGAGDDSVEGYDESENTIDDLPEGAGALDDESDGEAPDESENDDEAGADPGGNESADDEPEVDAGNETDTGDGADTGNETGEDGGANDGDVADGDETDAGNETDGGDGTDDGADSDTQTDGDDEADGDDGGDGDEEAEGDAETDSNGGTDTGTDGGDGIDADGTAGDGGADGVNATS